MSLIAKLFVFFSGLVFTFIVLNLLLKRKINERNSIVWFLGAGSILLVSANPGWLDWVAARVGIQYPPSLLFLFSNLILLLLVLHQSTQISALNEKLKQLAQHISISEQAGKKEED
ncbi:DUF2304 domain-containing protein [Paenibacillus sp.]|uniref:DUF2304 domain-containing protein n=1 Tax=Paenibacillus sp. TaxID=58172 RepID=UPI0028120D59|nr:DUF2304 domain-containing protein [Paenibacillus sp.]